MDLKGKRVLVTGASSGIGQAIAILCAQKGAQVCINYRKNKDGALETLKEVQKYSAGDIFQADLTDETQIEKMFAELKTAVGSVDVLVNNAGDAQPSEFFDTAAWKSQFDNIFFSALHVAQRFLKQNERAQLRKVVNISSVHGTPGNGDLVYFGYSVAKAALSHMTILLARVDPNVQVNAIAPGYTWTPSWGEMTDQEKKVYTSRTTIGRYTTPEEVAQITVAVIENDSIVGQVITVDGGLSLQSLT